MAIQKLPEEVKSAVRSGIAISSTAQCVTELVMNALDAGATSIKILLDIPNFKLEIDDNGHGITLDNLRHVGIRYHTSKCRTMDDLKNNLKYNGYRGEALASLSESCGFLVIVTRPKNSESDKTYLKAFTRGKPQRPIESSSRRKNHGTTATVQDFMCHAPVRQKRIIPNVDIEEIRIQVEGIALTHPHVSFTIMDDSDNSIVRRIPSTSSTLETFTQLYGLEISKNLCSIGPFTSGKLTINGFISTSSYHNKRLQFIFVNGRLVKGTKIHKLINMIMRKSDVLRGNGPWQELPMPDRMRDFLWVSPLKKRDRYCVFVVHISCPISEYDITLDPKKTLIEFCDWDTLFECTETVVKSFLKEHNLALISPDEEIVNSSSSIDSPSSVINEMEKLEKEDALGQKLNHFRCPVEAHVSHGKLVTSEKSILNMKTAIHSIPAKRNLSYPLDSGKFQEHNPMEEEVMEKVGNSGRNGTFCDKIRATSVNYNANELAGITSIEKVSQITFPLLRGVKDTPINSFDDVDSSHQFNFRSTIQDSGYGSLGRFRKTFQKSLVNSLHTPDDIQKIVVDDPPPIIRRQAPLEHRIKTCTNSKTFINASVNTVTTIFNEPKVAGICKNQPLLSKQLREFAFDRNIINKPGKSIYLSQKKDMPQDYAVTYSRNVSDCNDIVSMATQTESNIMEDWESTVKTQSLDEEIFKPNLQNPNLRRRQYQETISNHDRIKVCKYDVMNRNVDNIIEMRDNTNNTESHDDLQHEKNELNSLYFKPSGYMFQKQPQTNSDLLYLTGKTDTARQHEANKPNLKKLSLRKKYFEEAMNECEIFKTGAKQSISVTRIHYDSLQTSNNPVNDISLTGTRKQNKKLSEQPSIDKHFLTSEDFICSLEMAKGFPGSVQSKFESSISKYTSEILPVSSHFDEHVQYPVSVNNEKMPGNMPVLEPYYNSSFNNASHQLGFHDSPPSLLEDDYDLHHLDKEIQSKILAPCKQLMPELPEKTLSNSCVTEGNPDKYEDSIQKANITPKEHFENLKGHCSPNLTKSGSCILNMSSIDTATVCHEKSASKIHSLVPMYNSDSEDDVTDEVHDMEIISRHSENISSSNNTDENDILVDTETHIVKSKCLTQENHLDSDGFLGGRVESIGSSVESTSKVCKSQISFGQNNDIVELGKTFSEDVNHLDCDKEQFVENDNPSPLISHGQSLEYFHSQEDYGREILNGDVGNRIPPKSSVPEGGKIRSPFFADSSEWDIALSEMCNELETNDRVKTMVHEPESVKNANGDQNSQNNNMSHPQENRFEMLARPAFCPKGLSPVMPVNFPQYANKRNELSHVLSSQEGNYLHSIIKENSMTSDELSWIKWGKNINGSCKEFPCGDRNAIENGGKDMLAYLLAEKQKQKLISETEILSARVENQSKSFVRVFNLIKPCTFSKDVLSQVKMVGKLDCKFIVAKVILENKKNSDTIVLFDQHAVHERIRLERLTQDYQIRDEVTSDNSQGFFKYKSAPAVPAFEMTLNTSEARLLDSFHKDFERLGLSYDVQDGNKSGSGDTIIKINEVPACLLSKEAGSLGLKEQLYSLIREQVEHLLVTRGMGIFTPTTLRDAINMKACRGAVKFGDSLSDQECRWLLRKLSACDTPFQCAHGRPSMYPIIELKQLNRFYGKNKEECKPRLWRLKKMMEYAASHHKKIKASV